MNTNTILFTFDGNPDRIPKIGTRVKLQQYLHFEVHGYGEIETKKGDFYASGETSTVELQGVFVIPAGTPIEVLNQLLHLGEKE
jgi:hypothetical protein